MIKKRKNIDLSTAIKACRQLESLPDSLSFDGKIRRGVIREIVRNFSGLSPDDQKVFFGIVKEYSSQRNLFDIMTAVSEVEGGSTVNKDDISFTSDFELHDDGEINNESLDRDEMDISDKVKMYQKAVLPGYIKKDVIENIENYLDEHEDEVGYKVCKEHPEDENDNTTRIEFTIGGYHYKFLFIDGQAHSDFKYRRRLLKPRYKGISTLLGIYDVDSGGMGCRLGEEIDYKSEQPFIDLKKWNNRALAEYVEGKMKDEDYHFIDEDEFNNSYNKDFEMVDSNAMAVLRYLTLLGGNYPCKTSKYSDPEHPVGKNELRGLYSGRNGQGFKWINHGQVCLALVSRTKVK